MVKRGQFHQPTVVNFINFLWAHLRQYSCAKISSNLKCKYKKAVRKCWRNWHVVQSANAPVVILQYWHHSSAPFSLTSKIAPKLYHYKHLENRLNCYVVCTVLYASNFSINQLEAKNNWRQTIFFPRSLYFASIMFIKCLFFVRRRLF
jgi:hypothetical protein